LGVDFGAEVDLAGLQGLQEGVLVGGAALVERRPAILAEMAADRLDGGAVQAGGRVLALVALRARALAERALHIPARALAVVAGELAVEEQRHARLDGAW